MARLEASSELPISLSITPGVNFDPHLLSQISRLDNKLFCGEPWYEGDFCHKCGAMKFIAEDQIDPEAEVCADCGIQQVSVQLRSLKIGRELAEDRSLIAVAFNNDEEVVGYGWGFVFSSPADFAYHKYYSDEMRQTVLNAITDFGIHDEFYYYSGMGIDFEYRGKGISNILGKSVDDYARSLALPGITRTRFDSPIVKMRRRLGFNIIVGSELSYVDSENPDRVLMARH